MAPADVRLGVIGAGPWGRNIIRTLRTLAGVRLTRLASRNPESPRLVDADCAIAHDWREVACAGDLDGVVVATPPIRHPAIVETALSAGLAVMVEKPLALDLEGALQIEAAARRAGGWVLVNHIQLFHPAYEALRLRGRQLGSLISLDSSGGNWGPFRGADTPALWDYGPHDISLCLDLAAEMPQIITATRTDERVTNGGYGELVELRLGFAGGVDARITVGNLMAEKSRCFHARYEHGQLVFDDLAPHKLVEYPSGHSHATANGPHRPSAGIPVETGNEWPLTVSLQRFVAGIRSGTRDQRPLARAVDVIRVLSACEAQLPKRLGG